MSKNKKLVKFALTIFVISFLLVQFSLAQTTEGVGCCAKTTNGNTCVDYTYQSDCQTGAFYNGVCANVPDCKLITCATPDGCLFNYPKLSCETNGGSISLLAMPAVCEQGCCGIANRGYGVITKKECQDKTTIELGYELSKMEFIAGLTSERECDLRFAGADRGCCYNGAATCSFGTRGECLSGNGIFRQGIYCSQIVECEAEANKSQGCGIMNGDYNKLCNFDSQGNQEDCYQTCWTQNESCQVNLSSGRSVPSCVSTQCNIPAGFYQQQMSNNYNGPILTNVPFTGIILNGHSKCYNFYTSNDKENPITEVAFGKSTGLQNNKIVCMYGDIVSAGLGTDRNTLCVDGQNTSHAYTQTNKWQSCSDCGKGSSIGDFIGEFFSAGLTTMDLTKLVSAWLGKGEGTALLSFNAPLATLANRCTKSACESSGFCVYHAEITKGVTMPGGQGARALGINTQDIGASCSPKYTPGTTASCGLCGGGGDSLFNMCEEKKCLRLGNCEFESNGGLEQVGIGALYGFMLATSAKFNVIPEYVLIDCAVGSVPGIGYFGCVQKGIADEIGSFVVSPIKSIFETATKAKGVWKYLFQPMWSSLSSKVTDLIPLGKK